MRCRRPRRCLVYNRAYVKSDAVCVEDAVVGMLLQSCGHHVNKCTTQRTAIWHNCHSVSTLSTETRVPASLSVIFQSTHGLSSVASYFYDLLSGEGNAVGRVRPSTCFIGLSFDPTGLDLDFCTCVGHDQSSLGESEG